MNNYMVIRVFKYIGRPLGLKIKQNLFQNYTKIYVPVLMTTKTKKE